MLIQLYDTLERNVKPLEAGDDHRLRFYCCGPTVYAPAHIGNFRTFLLQDVLRRAVEMSGTPVLHVRNITDVDDKTINNARAEGKSLKEFTGHWTDLFHKDCAELAMLPPHKEPRATEHIPQQIELIRKLLEKGHAYRSADGSVYFRVTSFAAYGKLSHLDKRELQSQATTSSGNVNDADEYDRESIRDFALWKARKPEDGETFWSSPWGEGRPGWHIECSAMSMAYLGETFDLHGGGVDLCFPHHENEIAQSEAATGKPLARHWFHSAHLMVEGEKMSKSLGNLYTLAEIKEKGFSPAALRWVLISAHYRQSLNFTMGSLKSAESALKKLRKHVGILLEATGISEEEISDPVMILGETGSDCFGFEQTWKDLTHDLNTPAALGDLFRVLNTLDTESLARDRDSARKLLFSLAKILYVLGVQVKAEAVVKIPPEVTKLAEERWAARKNRDWGRADALRAELGRAGWTVLDHKDGYSLEPKKPVN
ncbi:MAG: cysteine--tRNA ligase [Opitutales bacterium]